jgi:hypothetical protein
MLSAHDPINLVVSAIALNAFGLAVCGSIGVCLS